ncbi:MAG: hypothetical protein PHQ65_14525 [Bacteroidales bacterium]|nr:hypothetical protein [Bacteroidales bacterium]MDD3666477.1 hypothetical protein [Bacteroidales bacterium]
MKKIFPIMLLAILFTTACSKDDDTKLSEKVLISFILQNELLWHISHDYKVETTSTSGESVMGTEKTISYFDVLAEALPVKNGSTVKLYKNGGLLWTSDPLKKSCTITYHDTPYEGGDYIEIQ